MKDMVRLSAARADHRSLRKFATEFRKQRLSSVSTLRLPPARGTEWLIVLGSILALSLLAYGLFAKPMLYSDDWSQGLEFLLNGQAAWLDPSNRRPLLYAPFLLQHSLFGVNVLASWSVLMLLHVASALLIYRLASSFGLAHGRYFALFVALLVLVYPANYSHMWLTMLHGYSAVLLGLAAFYLLHLFARYGNWTIYAAAMGSLWISFLIYEIHAGLALLWCGLLLLVFRRASWAVRLGLLLAAVQILIFAHLRTAGYQALGIHDEYFRIIDLTPTHLLQRLLQGYKVILAWSWAAGVRQLLQIPGGNLSLLALLAGASLGAGCLARWGVRRLAQKAPDAPDGAKTRVRRPLQQYLAAAAFGLLMIGAGYVPVITMYEPSLSGLTTRVNLVALLGGAVLIGALLMLVAQGLGRRRPDALVFFVAAGLPLLLLGTAIQVAINRDNAQSWQEQKQIWQAVFTAVPDLKEGSELIFLLPGYADRFTYETWKRPPLAASWDATSGLRLFYGKLNLRANVVFPDTDLAYGARLTPAGVFDATWNHTTPYTRVVAALYDSQTESLRVLTSLPAAWVPGAAADVALCGDCVLSEHAEPTEMRNLVQ